MDDHGTVKRLFREFDHRSDPAAATKAATRRLDHPLALRAFGHRGAVLLPVRTDVANGAEENVLESLD
jgi:hypothetical protein